MRFKYEFCKKYFSCAHVYTRRVSPFLRV